MIKTFFFDRDGVLIKNYGYVFEPAKVKWLKGSISAIKYLNKKKIKVAVITNQSGIGRGYFTEKDLKKLHLFLNKNLKTYGAKIDDFFYCPYHTKEKIKKYKKKTNLRKPGNGMLLKAIKKYKISPKQCFMIGDEKKDFLSAKKTQIKFEYKKKISLENKVKKIIKYS